MDARDREEGTGATPGPGQSTDSVRLYHMERKLDNTLDGITQLTNVLTTFVNQQMEIAKPAVKPVKVKAEGAPSLIIDTPLAVIEGGIKGVRAIGRGIGWMKDKTVELGHSTADTIHRNAAELRTKKPVCPEPEKHTAADLREGVTA